MIIRSRGHVGNTCDVVELSQYLEFRRYRNLHVRRAAAVDHPVRRHACGVFQFADCFPLRRPSGYCGRERHLRPSLVETIRRAVGQTDRPGRPIAGDPLCGPVPDAIGQESRDSGQKQGPFCVSQPQGRRRRSLRGLSLKMCISSQRTLCNFLSGEIGRQVMAMSGR